LMVAVGRGFAVALGDDFAVAAGEDFGFAVGLGLSSAIPGVRTWKGVEAAS
jgi:hypothetical protein